MSSEQEQKKNVLIISGAPHLLVETKIELMPYFDVSIAGTSNAAISALGMHDISAVIICVGENRDVAFAIINSIFTIVEGKGIPIIFLAEKGNDYDETAAFELGAVDYTTKRRGTTNAMINRIRLRINASEHEKFILTGRGPIVPHEVSPEAVLPGKAVLVVDDIDINREIVLAMLSGINDLTMDTAGNGIEAVEMFEKAPDRYSLILMDIHMPEMNGFEATKLIRSGKSENARKVPIIALTADTQESEVERCFTSGMNDYMEKPLTADKLFAAVAEHCS